VGIWSYQKNDPTFVKDLKESHQHVQKVAGWLQEHGLDAQVQELKIRGEVQEMRKFADNGDIYIGEHRIEVKQRRVKFTGPDDFPYPTVFVDVAHTWKRALREGCVPFAYIITNKDSTSALVVFGDTHEEWQLIEKWDRAKKRKRKFLEAPIKLAQPLSALVERLRSEDAPSTQKK